MSGLKINYDKSEIFVLGCTPEVEHRVAETLNCNVGKLPSDGGLQTFDGV
jgi:hypothetical protein